MKELKVGDRVIVTYRDFYGPTYLKTTIEKETPTGQLVIAHKDKTRFKKQGTYYKCVSGSSASIELFNQEKWDKIVAEVEHERLSKSLAEKMPKFSKTATIEQLRQIEAIMNENFISKKGVK